MSRKKPYALAAAFALVLTFAAEAQTPRTLDAAAGEAARYLETRFPKGTRAALLYAEAENAELGGYVLNRLSIALVNGGYFTVVERDAAALESIKGEMERHLNAEVSMDTELSIGKQLGAEIIVRASFGRQGGEWRLDVGAFYVESAERAAAWSSPPVRAETQWASLAAGKSAVLLFDGEIPSARDRQTLMNGLRAAVQTHGTSLEIAEGTESGAGYAFTVRIYREEAGGAASGLVKAEVTVDFSQNGRVLASSPAYYITETNDSMIARRVTERLRGDKALFDRIKELIK